MATGIDMSDLTYTYPVERLAGGHSFGNSHAYTSLDAKTDLSGARDGDTGGLRESTNQRYYLSAWDVSVISSDGEPFVPVTTTLAPAYQESMLQAPSGRIAKRFFLPFESSYLRSAHFLLTGAGAGVTVRSRALFPMGVRIDQSTYKGRQYMAARFPDGAVAVIWSSGALGFWQAQDTAGQGVEVQSDHEWVPTASSPDYALSFAYALGDTGGSKPDPKLAAQAGGTPPDEWALLGALFDNYGPDAPGVRDHLTRVHHLLAAAMSAVGRYLDTSRLHTPDPVINRAVQWAKLNQLRDQQEYRWGAGFSNHPPSDVVVGRDSVWYLMGSTYYAQAWSRKVLDFWFRYGQAVSGKFTEYVKASQDAMFTDDYGLNINDNTPLFLIVAHQYYALTGDRAFLDAVYPSLLNAANYILAQRNVGENNHFGLVWCTSTETFVRGLCGWRNAIRNYNLSGAVTEVNAECYRALQLTAELARSVGDERNGQRLAAAADDLRDAIQTHLRSDTDSNPFYYLNIDPSGVPVRDRTADLLFPVLFGVADPALSEAIVRDLFGPDFWAGLGDGAGGIRTVSAAEAAYQPKADEDNYGLLGGVWPNVALWTAKAAADRGLPDLSQQALRGTYLLSEREEPARYNVLPGEFPEYFDGDDLMQRGMRRSTFIPGIYIWSVLEGLLGLSPHPDELRVTPVLPSRWGWAAVSNLPYRGYPLSLLVVKDEQTIYTTAPVGGPWHQVVAPDALQQRFSFRSDARPFWLVVPRQEGYEVFAASSSETTGQLLDRRTGIVLVELSIPAGSLVRGPLPRVGG